MTRRLLALLVATVAAWGAFVACTTSNGTPTTSGACASLATCCASMTGANGAVCTEAALAGVAATCQADLSAYQASSLCSPNLTLPDSGPSGSSCFNLGLCCPATSSPATCEQLVAAGDASVCATELAIDQAAGSCGSVTRDGGPVSTGDGGTGCPGGCNPGESCVGGVCACTGACTGSYMCNATDRCVAAACSAGGATCTTFSDCCSGTCAQQVCTSCSASGLTCSGDGDCCSGLTCYEGSCGLCSANGSSCTLASDCCSNTCSDGECQACGTLGTTCGSQLPCCAGTTCPSGGGSCCAAAQQTCGSDTDCCTGLTCQQGACAAPTACGASTCEGCVTTKCSTLTSLPSACTTCWTGCGCGANCLLNSCEGDCPLQEFIADAGETCIETTCHAECGFGDAG